MSDRTQFQGTIYRCNPVVWDQIVRAVEEYVSGSQWSNEPEGINLGQQFSNDEVSCGVVDDLSARLVEIDPTIVFSMWEDPKYEWLGEAAVYVGNPDMGIFRQECDANGQVLVNYELIGATGILLSPESDDYTTQGHLDAQHKMQLLFGRYHYEEIEEIVASLKTGEGTHSIEVFEQVDSGSDPGWRAYCTGCQWYSKWFIADDYQDEAELRMKRQALARGEEVAAAENNPMQLAHDAAVHNGEQHMLHPPVKREGR